MQNKFSVFGLTAEQSEILFALQRKLTFNDVHEEGKKKPILGSNKRGQKQLWLNTNSVFTTDYYSIFYR